MYDDYSLSRIGFSRDDLKQELTLKLYLTIRKYCLKFLMGEVKTFKGLDNYIFRSLKNFMTNILKSIIKEQNNRKFSLSSIEQVLLYSVKDNDNYKIEIDFDHFYFEGIDVLECLNSKERIIFRRYILGYKVREISRKFNVPVGTVLTCILNSKKKIRKLLKKERIIL